MTGDNYVATLTLGGAGAHATYYHKANDQVHNTSNIVYGCIYVVLVQNLHTSLKDDFKGASYLLQLNFGKST